MKSPDELTDAEFILLDAGWPFWPALPVKKRTSERAIGVIMATKITRVWHANFWDPSVLGVEGLPYTDYDSVDALVADGWVVD